MRFWAVHQLWIKLGGSCVRIDKLLAHTGYSTRKQVRQLIKHKDVAVNGEIITSHGLHVHPENDKITVSGEAVHYTKYIYLMLHKPKKYITATYDQHELTVIDLVPAQYAHVDLSPVGRLDKDTEGLILLTNDGKLNHILTSPKNNIWKTYKAIVAGIVNDEHIEKFKLGVALDDGYKTKSAKLNVIHRDLNKSTISLAITEGKFHKVKRMFSAINMEVLYLKRNKIGEID